MSIDFLPEYPELEFVTPSAADLALFKILMHIRNWGKNPGRKVSSILQAAEGQILATGYNGLPANYRDEHPAFAVRPMKGLCQCAEVSSSTGSKMLGISPAGCTETVSWGMCDGCALVAVEDKVDKVRMLVRRDDYTKDKWSPRLLRGLHILLSNGTEVELFDAEALGYGRLMDRVADTKPLPSGSTNWSERISEFTKVVQAAGGSGEVIMRPGSKIIQSIGFSTSRSKMGALEVANLNNIDIAGCVIFVPHAPGRLRLVQMAHAGLRKVITPHRLEARHMLRAVDLPLKLCQVGTPDASFDSGPRIYGMSTLHLPAKNWKPAIPSAF